MAVTPDGRGEGGVVVGRWCRMVGMSVLALARIEAGVASVSIWLKCRWLAYEAASGGRPHHLRSAKDSENSQQTPKE